ncbi:hypothetical protein DFJ67_7440 [Asanoa ferruginea]|uniref:Uncharacterized protein n=1 Tax=Asanoa ferruginea TaxID=53367 RepID=A0A3D9ZVM0_9ACTN|nr:hypothetical protein [Asanoa ferruginea]REG01357.1 hypothetical protein DFJ67_7440 [Asanoa ferruginea]GIF52153.1 hypothetical protein Afe04nite_66920 [Asanoa ferruginea]
MRYVSAVAFYGPKKDPLASLLSELQDIVARSLGRAFRPYVLDQIHGTLIALGGASGVNDFYREHRGARKRMDYPAALRMLTAALTDPLTVQFGGVAEELGFSSRGQALRTRCLSEQGGSVVIIGWPTEAFRSSGADRRLDELRRRMISANVLHRYHATPSDVDDDLYMVLGHCHGADLTDVTKAVDAGRGYLAARPTAVTIQMADVSVVAADTPTLLPTIRTIPLAQATVADLIELNGG